MSLSKRIFGVRGWGTGAPNFKTASWRVKRAFNESKYSKAGREKMADLVGDNSLIKAFEHMRLSSVRKIMRPAVSAGLTVINREAKSLVKVRTGQLKKAIGKKIRTRKSAVVGYIHVREGYAHIVDGITEDPRRYAWYLEFEQGGKNSFMRKARTTKKVQANKALRAKARERLDIEAARAAARGRTL